MLTIVCLLLFIILVEGSVRIISTNVTLMAKPATFGPRVGPYGLLASIHQPLEDVYGCEIVQGPSQWIALVKRGRCSFYHKVQAMQQSGALAVLVGDEDSTVWITMYSKEVTTDITIPSLFLTRDEYQTLAQQHTRLVLLEHEDKVPWSRIDCLYLFLTLCPVFLFTLGWAVARLTSKASPHLTDADLERYLPRQHYSPKTDDECPICLDWFDMGDYRVLPCQHVFHASCIDPWLTQYRTSCPVCNKESFSHSI